MTFHFLKSRRRRRKKPWSVWRPALWRRRPSRSCSCCLLRFQGYSRTRDKKVSGSEEGNQMSVTFLVPFVGHSSFSFREGEEEQVVMRFPIFTRFPWPENKARSRRPAIPRKTNAPPNDLNGRTSFTRPSDRPTRQKKNLKQLPPRLD